jgi:hypothetical protein
MGITHSGGTTTTFHGKAQHCLTGSSGVHPYGMPKQIWNMFCTARRHLVGAFGVIVYEI